MSDLRFTKHCNLSRRKNVLHYITLLNFVIHGIGVFSVKRFNFKVLKYVNGTNA